MPDAIANFSLRGASSDDLAAALANCYREAYTRMSAAVLIADFPKVARQAGVETILFKEVASSLSVAFIGFEDAAIGVATATSNAEKEVQARLKVIDRGTRLSAAVVLHDSFDRVLWRFTRFGIVADRAAALTIIKQKAVKVGEFTSRSVDETVDVVLESWWEDLDRESLPDKWKTLAKLGDYPPLLKGKGFQVDFGAIERFDKLRHDAVHSDASILDEFDLPAAVALVAKCEWAWFLHLKSTLALQAPVIWPVPQPPPPI